MSILEQPTILILDAPPTAGTPENETLLASGIQARIIEWPALDPPAREAALAQADFILTWKTDVNEALLGHARRCLLVLHYGPGTGTGVARVAMETARQAGIYVSSVPDYAPEDWAHETFQLIQRLMQEQPVRPNQPIGILKGLRLGVVGFGSVGRHVARRGKEGGMDVWACDPFVGEAWFDQRGVRPADLATIMGVSDIVTLHVPLGPATRRMISAYLLNLMREHSLLINTADPDLVDLAALDSALKRGRPAAAAFDDDLTRLVPAGSPLLTRPSLIHGPCRAGQSAASAQACRDQAARMIAHVLQGNRPSHLLIDPPCPRHILLLAGQAWA